MCLPHGGQHEDAHSNEQECNTDLCHIRIEARLQARSNLSPDNSPLDGEYDDTQNLSEDSRIRTGSEVVNLPRIKLRADKDDPHREYRLEYSGGKGIRTQASDNGSGHREHQQTACKLEIDEPLPPVRKHTGAKPKNAVVRAVPTATERSSFSTIMKSGEKNTAPPMPDAMAVVAMRIETGKRNQESNVTGQSRSRIISAAVAAVSDQTDRIHRELHDPHDTCLCG